MTKSGHEESNFTQASQEMQAVLDKLPDHLNLCQDALNPSHPNESIDKYKLHRDNLDLLNLLRKCISQNEFLYGQIDSRARLLNRDPSAVEAQFLQKYDLCTTFCNELELLEKKALFPPLLSQPRI